METVILTDDMLQKGMSENGGWSNKQLRKLGVHTPLRNGWRRRLDGKRVNVESYTEFLALKDAHLKNKRNFKKGKSSILGKSISFIIDNFTEDDKFKCPHIDCHSMECDTCDTRKAFIEITGLED